MKITTDMLIQMQIAADLVLLIVLIFFFWYVSGALKKKERGPSGPSLGELRQLIEDSKRVSEEFMDAIDAGRRSLRGLLQTIDEKERHLSLLLERSESLNTAEKKRDDLLTEQGHQKVLDMAAEGISAEKIADLLDLTEGEVKLILNLHSRQRKNIE